MENFKTFQIILHESQGQNLALTVLYVPCSLDSGPPHSELLRTGHSVSEHIVGYLVQGNPTDISIGSSVEISSASSMERPDTIVMLKNELLNILQRVNRTASE